MVVAWDTAPIDIIGKTRFVEKDATEVLFDDLLITGNAKMIQIVFRMNG